MGKPSWWIVIGVGGWAGCNPSLVGYCAPGSPECTPADGGTGDTTMRVGEEREAEGSETTAPDVSTCDPTKSPHDDPCVVGESYGVFVSPAGSDANPGTRSSPLSTIGRGMDLGKAAGKRVYVCAGSFDERLVVGASRDGVGVYGGLDCTTWAYSTGNRVVVAPAAAGYALELDGLRAGATFEDIEFDTQNASPAHAGESSIAVFANGSRNVALQRVTMAAGHGAEGSSGTSGGPGPDGGASAAPSNWLGTPPGYAELNGINAADAGGAPSTTCTCPDQSTSSGGQGGTPNGQAPSAGMPSYGDAGAGAGGVNASSCGSGGTAQNGADAPDAAANPASTALGACAASGWTPAVGVNGADGKPGQGGGGGGNGRLSSGSGGGGACGGCGGAGGKAGSGGGSSIALLSYQSSVALAGCMLTSKGAGNGGAGGSGEPGQSGGGGGSGFPTGNLAASGCAGGAGGAGAGGNGAQGGPGGLSLGIGYCGLPPTIDGVVVTQAASRAGITLGSAGVAGAGGSKGAAATSSTGPAGADGAPGPDGIAAAIGSLP